MQPTNKPETKKPATPTATKPATPPTGKPANTTTTTTGSCGCGSKDGKKGTCS